MRRVLVLEADQVLKDMMAELLSRDGCAVMAVRSIGEAVSCLSSADGEVDMLIFDADTVSVSTPADTLAKWRAWLAECIQPPACVVVSVQAASARHLGFFWAAPGGRTQAGEPATWLRKPFRNEEFLSVVRQSHGGRQAGAKAQGRGSSVSTHGRQR